ncbi:MAG TPA: protein kinase, partial [Acidimicrobiales bacterium]
MSPFAPGAVLANRYALDRKLGDDGLTEVWTATDRVLARQVVVEGASEEAGDAGRAAFREAAAAAARLVHSGIVATYDSGVVDGAPYIVTERPAGATLAELVARGGPLAPGRVVVVGRQLARALQVAHGQGVTHGGVGPRTVLVTEDDRAKLSRFAACGARARLGGATAEKEADVHACAAALVTALVGSEGAVSPRAARSGVPPALDEVLVAAQEGGSITDAGALAAALDGLDIDDDAVPLV